MRASLPRLVDLAAQLEADALREPEALRRRDRALGQALGDAAGDAEGAVAAWLDRVRPDEGESEGEQVARADRALGAGLWLLGAVFGAVTSAALFRYDGSHPVNVVHVLAVFVLLQLLLLALTLVLALPERLRRVIPGLAALQDGLALLSPGRWRGAAQRLLSGAQRDALERVAGRVRRHRRLYGDVQKWWLLRSSQGFAVAFHLAALVTALVLVAFSDLAFAWSTTLDVDAAALERWTSLLSRPWAAWAPAAVPAPELITATQYFRAETGHDPAASAPWWPFLLACMAVYGLLPRVAVLGFARWRLAASVRTAIRRMPGVAALRDRLESRLVETTSPDAEGEAGPLDPGDARPPTLEAGAPCRVVAWAGFPLADVAAARDALGVEALSFHPAGGVELDGDRETLAALREAGGEAPVLLVAKAWEPPVLELLDFLGELRATLGEGRPILVVPLALDEAGRPVPPRAVDARQWQRAADRLGDPWTSLHTVGGGP